MSRTKVVVALLGVVAVTLITVGRWSSRGAGSPIGGEPPAEIATAVRRAEAVYEEVLAPVHEEGQEIDALSGLPDLEAREPTPAVDLSGRHSFLSVEDQRVLTARADDAIGSAFGESYADRYRAIVHGVIRSAASGQELLGGGGASVRSFLRYSLDGRSESTVVAQVDQWSRTGVVSAETGAVRWSVARATVEVTDRLERFGDGWRVVDRSWRYLPGEGP
jgi:hypothetical protein